MQRKALVVGGTAGIGEGIALQLARMGMDVTIAGRSAERGSGIVQAMTKLSPSNHFRFTRVDCFDLDAVRDLAQQAAQGPLDYLILTPGIATTQGFTPTRHDLDQKMTVHYYARVLLAQTLAPSMAAGSSDPRILLVLSAGVHGAYGHWEDDPGLSRHYTLKNAADAAGFYTDIALDQLAGQTPGVVFAHAAPGFVSTSWGTELNVCLRGSSLPLLDSPAFPDPTLPFQLALPPPPAWVGPYVSLIPRCHPGPAVLLWEGQGGVWRAAGQGAACPP